MWIAAIICFLAAILSYFFAVRWSETSQPNAFLGVIFFVCSTIAAAGLALILSIVQVIMWVVPLYNQ